MDHAERVMDDIRSFKERPEWRARQMIWCGSTEVYHEADAGACHAEGFRVRPAEERSGDFAQPDLRLCRAEDGHRPYANGAPHLTTDMPALLELARNMNVPVAGKDYKSGQTFMKTLIAPGLKSRMLGLNGWFSTNILGNRDGEVLDEPGSFRSKEGQQVVGAGVHSAEATCTPICTRSSTTRSASSTIRRAAMPRKAGTTSTFSDGWATRCRSRSISCAATRFWRRR